MREQLAASREEAAAAAAALSAAHEEAARSAEEARPGRDMGEMWGDVGRCGEMWGRCEPRAPLRRRARAERGGGPAQRAWRQLPPQPHPHPHPTAGPLTPTLPLPLPRTCTRARNPTPEQVGQWRQRAHAWQRRAGQWRRRARGAGGEEAGQGQRAGSEAEVWCQSVALVALAERDLMAQACWG